MHNITILVNERVKKPSELNFQLSRIIYWRIRRVEILVVYFKRIRRSTFVSEIDTFTRFIHVHMHKFVSIEQKMKKKNFLLFLFFARKLKSFKSIIYARESNILLLRYFDTLDKMKHRHCVHCTHNIFLQVLKYT